MEIKGTKPHNVECFKYLGSAMTSTYIMGKEVLNRLAIAGASIGRLWTQVWGKRVITVRNELQVYKVIVISSLLCAVRLGRSTKVIVTLDQLHLRCPRKIMCISCRANMLGLEPLIMKAQLRWIGPVVRMDDTRLPKMVFFSELATVARNKGRPVKRFKETG